MGRIGYWFTGYIFRICDDDDDDVDGDGVGGGGGENVRGGVTVGIFQCCTCR